MQIVHRVVVVVGRGKRCGEVTGYSHNHLLATQERVADELARAQGNGGVVVRHGVGCRGLEGREFVEVRRETVGWW